MKRGVLFCAALLAALTATAAVLQMQQQTMAEKMIRLHVVANSDTAEDQAIKLQIRDAVLKAAEGLEAEDLQTSLPMVRKAARDCLRSLGSSHTVEVTLGPERFPTRHYETFSLPAGVYTALRVTIGEGTGQNWWCVAFPSICLPATAEAMEVQAASAGFTPGEIALITGEPEYVLKFKSLELLERWKTWMFDREKIFSNN